jgi:hypothetical protein
MLDLEEHQKRVDETLDAIADAVLHQSMDCNAIADAIERLPPDFIQVEVRARATDVLLRAIVRSTLNDLSPTKARQLIQERAALLPS